MICWLLADLIPIRLTAIVVLVVLGLQFGGVDVFGFLTTNIVDPIIDWLTQEVLNNLI